MTIGKQTAQGKPDLFFLVQDYFANLFISRLYTFPIFRQEKTVTLAKLPLYWLSVQLPSVMKLKYVFILCGVCYARFCTDAFFLGGIITLLFELR